MKRISRLAVVVAAMAIFLSSFQAQPYYRLSAGGSKNGDVPVVTG